MGEMAMQMRPHEHMEKVTVSDEREGEALRHFSGLVLGPQPEGDETQWVAWWCTDGDNGFGKPIGPQLDQFKHLGDNCYGA